MAPGPGARPRARAPGRGPGPRAVGHPWARATGLGPGLGGWCVCLCAWCVFVRRACVQRVRVRACVAGVKPIVYPPDVAAPAVEQETKEEAPTEKEEEEEERHDRVAPLEIMGLGGARKRMGGCQGSCGSTAAAVTAEFEQADAGVRPPPNPAT